MNRDFSIIDANFARAREGLRVLDDSARFVLRSQSLFTQIKNLRHTITECERAWKPIDTVVARQENDVGEKINGIQYRRHSLYSIIRANSRRVAEALRVLEEFALLYNNDGSRNLAEARYTIYKLETAIIEQTPHYYLEKYFTEGIIYPIADNTEDITWLVSRGARMVQFRNKKDNKIEIESQVKELCQTIGLLNKKSKNKILLILNDHVDIAAKFPVAGVHIGQGDGRIAAVRQLLGSNKIIGRSTHSLIQAKEAVKDGADYISIGPVFATPTKAEKIAVGLSAVREIANEVTIPWLAIGGIDPQTINQAREAGAKNVAVVRAAREFFEELSVS